MANPLSWPDWRTHLPECIHLLSEEKLQYIVALRPLLELNDQHGTSIHAVVSDRDEFLLGAKGFRVSHLLSYLLSRGSPEY